MAFWAEMYLKKVKKTSFNHLQSNKFFNFDETKNKYPIKMLSINLNCWNFLEKVNSNVKLKYEIYLKFASLITIIRQISRI